jgi:hypothetical protein
MNPDPQLDTRFLSGFLRECHWMRKSRCWKERLLIRLAKAHLDTLTQQAIGSGVAQQPPGFAERVEKKRMR